MYKNFRIPIEIAIDHRLSVAEICDTERVIEKIFVAEGFQIDRFSEWTRPDRTLSLAERVEEVLGDGLLDFDVFGFAEFSVAVTQFAVVFELEDANMCALTCSLDRLLSFIRVLFLGFEGDRVLIAPEEPSVIADIKEMSCEPMDVASIEAFNFREYGISPQGLSSLKAYFGLSSDERLGQKKDFYFSVSREEFFGADGYRIRRPP
ncbi:MAG: hypothetical protein IPO35_12335 [Uliginosibacterium sp.]|nr:hypothetical protein [Uliginosibacterium sp.]